MSHLKKVSKSSKIEKLKHDYYHCIESFEKAESLADIPNVKKMQGFQTYFRVRLGDYRIGFELQEDGSILLILIAHRKEIYKYFP